MMAHKYASTTKVPVIKSRADVEKLCIKYGATSYTCGWHQQGSTVAFEMNGRVVKMDVPLAKASDYRYENQREQADRQMWRVVLLILKAKFELIETMPDAFEAEFLAYLVLPDGSTVGQETIPKLREAYETGQMPKLLPVLYE